MRRRRSPAFAAGAAVLICIFVQMQADWKMGQSWGSVLQGESHFSQIKWDVKRRSAAYSLI